MPTDPTHKPLPQRAFAYAISMLALTVVLILATANQTRDRHNSGTDITLEPIDTPGSETRLANIDIDRDQFRSKLLQRAAALPEDHQFVVMIDASDLTHPSAHWIEWFEGLNVPVTQCDIDHHALCPFTASSTVVLALHDAGGEDIRGLLDVGINVFGYGKPNNPSEPWALAITLDARAQGASSTRVHQASFPRARLVWLDAEHPPGAGLPGAPTNQRDGMLIALLEFLTQPLDRSD